MYNQTIILGILVSLLYTEITGFSAGLILPGYLALNIHQPQRIIFTLLVSVLAVFLCRLLSQIMILYGRRRFAMLILLTFFLGILFQFFTPFDHSIVGILIPGILARELDRQGFTAGILSMILTTTITALIILLIGGQIILF